MAEHDYYNNRHRETATVTSVRQQQEIERLRYDLARKERIIEDLAEANKYLARHKY